MNQMATAEQTETPSYLREIYGAERHFKELSCTNLKFQEEALHARMACEGNDYLMKAVHQSPGSLQKAVFSVATVGLSLNRATSYAFLVPRDGAVCLDISYRGLIKIATDTGAIRWAKAEIVYEKDHFLMKEMGNQPEHSFSPFGDRGKAVGCYCVAKTSDGDFLADAMSEDELNQIKDKSPSARTGYSPWNTFPHEMWKKVVIKRASKTWPRTERSERLQEAVEVINDHEGIDFKAQHTPEQLEFYLSTVSGDGKPSEHYCFIRSLEFETIASLGSAYKSTIERGGKGKEMKRIDSIYKEGESIILSTIQILEQSDDEFQISEIIQDLSQSEAAFIYSQLTPDAMDKVEQVKNSA